MTVTPAVNAKVLVVLASSKTNDVGDCPAWVCRLPGEQLLPSCIAGHTHAGGGGIMLWGTFSWAVLGPVVVVEQTMKAASYLNIIADQLHPYRAFVFPTKNRIIQQDNAPCHKACIVLEWFEEHTDEFHLF
ncbi:hypothetical protein AVEN_32256-1 [Araneus ventricosus]|uniref:Tc1-like transposase DDE domain-containing protein n=1 Tax=Araneus ventricosus TaxID=182803 RepID=A0A4Y2NE49_ARAVE|nr:hypothetical protein AVEN_32256-1 [Araneus ventricosus]